MLQPNRFERPGRNVLPKFYLDGDLPAQQIGSLIPLEDNMAKSSTILGRRVDFVRARNPHAGCFALTRRQLERWTMSPHFLDLDCSFVGPLESAATLGLIRHFNVYKPAAANRWFLEIEHCGTGYADRFIHPALPKLRSTASS